MAHSTKKEKADDRKYVQMAPETVQLLAESVGIDNLAPNIATSLSEDATYRTRELAHICSQFMRHSKRTRLTPADVTRALKWYDEQPILGHDGGVRKEDSSGNKGGGSNSDFVYCEDAEVFLPVDRPLELLDLSVDDTAKQPQADPDPIVRASWLTIEGTPVDGDNSFVEHPQNSSLSHDLIQFYQLTTSAMLEDSIEVINWVYNDISTNPKLSPLLPYYVSFVRSGIQKYGTQTELLKRLLNFVRALFSNPYFNFSPKPYLSHLVTALLSSLIPARPGREHSQQNGDCNNSPSLPSLRQLEASVEHAHLAANVLREVLDRWATPVNQLRCQTYRALSDCLNDYAITSPASQYGALVALTALGHNVLETYLLPIFPTYFQALSAKIQELESLKKPLVQIQEASIVYNQLGKALLAAVNTVVYSHSKKKRKTSSKRRWEAERILAASHSKLIDAFADALCTSPLPDLPNRPLNVPESETVGKLRLRSYKPPAAATTVVNGDAAQTTPLPTKKPRKRQAAQREPITPHNFDTLAGQGLPADIFEPMDTSLSPDRRGYFQRCRPDLLTPRKLSASVADSFETEGRVTTVRRYNDVNLNYGRLTAKEELQRKRFLAPVAVTAMASGHTPIDKIVMGHRMSYPFTTNRFRKQRLMSCSLQTLI